MSHPDNIYQALYTATEAYFSVCETISVAGHRDPCADDD